MNEGQLRLKRARWLEIGSFVYNAFEIVISLTAGFLSGKLRADQLGPRQHGRGRFGGHDDLASARRRSQDRVTSRALAQEGRPFGPCGRLWLLVAFIFYEAATKLLAQEAPRFSALGIGILVVALFVNPVLAWGKKFDSAALIYDAKDTLICQYQTIVVLIGLNAHPDDGLVVGRSGRGACDRAVCRMGGIRGEPRRPEG